VTSVALVVIARDAAGSCGEARDGVVEGDERERLVFTVTVMEEM